MATDTKRPTEDFDLYINEEWMKTNTIPPDQTRWGSFMILREDNLMRCRKICEEDAADPDSAPYITPELLDSAKLVSQLYKIARTQIEQSETAPEVLDLMDEIKKNVVDSKSYLEQCSKLFVKAGVSVHCHLFKMQDKKDSNNRLCHLYQTGLGLPDMAYYTDRKDLFDPYMAYIADVTRLFGHPVSGQAILDFEAAIAAKHLTRVECRDPHKTYNKCAFHEVQAKLPEFFALLEIPEEKKKLDVIVQNPQLIDFLKDFLAGTDPETLKSYLIFKVADKFAAFGTMPQVECHFQFHGKLLSGQLQLEDPWKRALSKVDRFIGDELGKLYVAKHFPEPSRKVCVNMVADICDAFRDTLKEIDWMSEDTKSEAFKKFDKFEPELGYPSQWHSIQGLWEAGLEGKSITRLAMDWSYWDWIVQEVAKFGTPPERKLWSMSPQTVNAYFSPVLNKIVFPAGILQLPFFGYEDYDSNLGAIGVVIGHEISHGYDDKGRLYNSEGELKDWWSKQDSDEFDVRAKVVVEHFSQQTCFGKNVNGELTLGENIADIGGIKIALRALKKHYNGNVPEEAYRRFFTAYAIIWRSLITEAMALKLLATDPHSPAKVRINAALAHIEEFHAVFGTEAGEGMFLEADRRMKIW